MKKPSKKVVAAIATLVVAVGGLGYYAVSHADEGKSHSMKIERHEQAAPVQQVAETAEEAPAEPEIDFVTDEAFLLTEDEQANFEAQAQNIYNNYGFEVHIATVSDTGGFTDTYHFAKSFYNKHDFGKDGMMLMISMDNMDCGIITRGDGKKLLTDYGNEKMMEACLEYFAMEDWVPGFQCYLDKSADYCYQYYVNGKAFDKPAKKDKAKNKDKDKDKKPAIEEEKPTPEESEAQKAEEERKRAAQEASECLSYEPYSRDRLIEALEDRGFSYDDAVYGIDSCYVDWGEQALRMAKEYTEYSSYTRQEVIDYLLDKGFTSEEAEHGADGLGEDYYAEVTPAMEDDDI